jgi:hypothetical protein
MSIRNGRQRPLIGLGGECKAIGPFRSADLHGSVVNVDASDRVPDRVSD